MIEQPVQLCFGAVPYPPIDSVCAAFYRNDSVAALGAIYRPMPFVQCGLSAGGDARCEILAADFHAGKAQRRFVGSIYDMLLHRWRLVGAWGQL